MVYGYSKISRSMMLNGSTEILITITDFNTMFYRNSQYAVQNKNNISNISAPSINQICSITPTVYSLKFGYRTAH